MECPGGTPTSLFKSCVLFANGKSCSAERGATKEDKFSDLSSVIPCFVKPDCSGLIREYFRAVTEDLILRSSQMAALALPANDYSKNITVGPTLSSVNSAWVAEGFKLKPSFEEIVRVVYNAKAKEVDFMNKIKE